LAAVQVQALLLRLLPQAEMVVALAVVVATHLAVAELLRQIKVLQVVQETQVALLLAVLAVALVLFLQDKLVATV
jgi:hypothetical protein